MILVTLMAPLWLTLPTETPQEEWTAINAEFSVAMEAWMEKLHEHNSKGMMAGGALPPHPAPTYRARVKAYAEKYAGKPEAIPALGWLVVNGTTFAPFPVTDDSFGWALDRLAQGHATDAAVGGLMGGLEMAAMSADNKPIVAFLETVADENPDNDVRCMALVTLVELDMTESPMAAMMGQTKKIDEPGLMLRLQKVLDAKPRDEIAARAKSLKFRLAHLQIGRPAPELIGQDVDGKQIKLSDHQGKVVAIIFWGTWCAPCMQMIPHEREMVAKLADKPFTLMGINVHDDKDTLKKTLRKERITWPTIFDGMEAPIAMRWGVRSFPAAYIVDHRGVIRHKNITPFQLESAVTALIAEATSSN